MKDGLYISAYCAIDDIASTYFEKCCIRHDQCIALWELRNKECVLIRYWELERITRMKQHMKSFVNDEHFKVFLAELLAAEGVSIDDIVCIFGMPQFADDMNYLSISRDVNLPFHSLSHIFSAIIDTEIQFKDNCIVFALDGGPDNYLDSGFDLEHHYAAAIFIQGELVDVKPAYSPAYLWTEASDRFRMREGTLMALAEACSCKYKDELFFNIEGLASERELPRLRADLDQVWNSIDIEKLDIDDRFSIEENKISCFMKIIQAASIKIVDKDIKKVLKEYKMDPKETYLSIVGGYALNCPTNTWIMERYQFKRFIAPPCVNDSGMALGIGILAFYHEYGKQLKFKLESAFFGQKFNFDDFVTRFDNYIEEISKFDTNTFVQDVKSYPVCWFEGESEIGPRALGHRSILAAANSLNMKNTINRIKQREWWRPVAPVVLSEVVSEWFCTNMNSEYMLHTVKVKKEKKKYIIGALHLDDTARIQTIDQKHSLYDVLVEYYKTTGVPVLCNTSLNDKGEPIVNSYEELMNFALRKNFRVIYVERNRIVLKNHRMFSEKEPYKNKKNMFDLIWNLHIPETKAKYKLFENMDDEMLDYYVNHRSLFDNDADVEDLIKQINQYLRKYFKMND